MAQADLIIQIFIFIPPIHNYKSGNGHNLQHNIRLQSTAYPTIENASYDILILIFSHEEVRFLPDLLTKTNIIKEAWHAFAEKGTIMEGVVRPEILKSWQRSLGVNPFGRVKPQTSNDILATRQNEYQELISAARPIMEELAHMIDKSSVCLADNEGLVLDVIGNAEFLPVGTCCKESIIGTNSIGTVLIDGKPLEISGYEHYRHCLHLQNSVGVPIRRECEIIGAICLTSPFHNLPKETLQVVSFAARSIGQEVTERSNLNSIIDCVQFGLFIIDGTGTIINVNKKSQELLGIYNRQAVISRSLGDYIVNDQNLLASLMGSEHNKTQFEIRAYDGVHSCSLRMKQLLRSSQEPEQTVLLFTFSDEIKSIAEKTFKPRLANELFSFKELVGTSEAWTRIKHLGKKAAKVTSNVLIVGESGTGKEMITQAIHNASNRKGPFIPINCGAIPKELLQSELFGYEDGSFTGAKKGGSIGKFELANGGTIFLDEIGEMPIEMQVSLLRFLEDKMVVRVGSAKSKTVDVRVIAATNRDLEDAINIGKFREDLYYRLNVINIKLPPLRQRKEDIPLLVNTMVMELCQELNLETPPICEETLNILFQYHWPGNVRELRNVIEHAVVFAEGDPITPDCLPQRLLQMKVLKNTGDLRNHELHLINKALSDYNGNISQAARALGITRSTLYRKIQEIKRMSDS
jgi:transcriptional regulator with PAS, ATPase and Fis domain